jgi:hypothetical protein
MKGGAGLVATDPADACLDDEGDDTSPPDFDDNPTVNILDFL